MAVTRPSVHPDERVEIVESLEKKQRAVERAERAVRRKRDALNAEVARAYPKLGMTLLRETLDLTRQRVHQMMEEHEEQVEEAEDA